MTREEHLKYCMVCVNRKIALNGEVVCALTDAKADFDPLCPSYEYSTEITDEEYSFQGNWLIFLAVGGLFLALLRFIISH